MTLMITMKTCDDDAEYNAYNEAGVDDYDDADNDNNG